MTLKDPLQKRADSFLPRIMVQKSFSNEDLEKTLRDFFPDNPSKAQIERVYQMFKESQKYGKGEAGAKYSKEKKKVPSGTYNDEDLLKEILQDSHSREISKNMAKAPGGLSCTV